MNGQLRSYFVNQGYNPNMNSGYETYNNTLVSINKALGATSKALTSLKTTHAYSNKPHQGMYVAGSQALYNMRLSNLRKQLQAGAISRQQYFDQVQLLNQLRSNVTDIKKVVETTVETKEVAKESNEEEEDE